MSEAWLDPWHRAVSLLPFEWAGYAFMRLALLAVLFIAPLLGALGTVVVANRLAFFSEAIGHAAFTGIALGVILGGRLFYVLFDNLDFFLANPAEIPAIWRGGMSFHGGLVGCATALIVLAKKKNLPILSFADLASAVVPLGLFFGRIANFINGELWGRVTDVWWAMVFPHAGPFPRHPSQLYEAVLEGLAILIILGIVIARGGLKKPGYVSGLFGVLYALGRIASEFFREPDPQLGFLFGGATMGMLLSLPLLAAGLYLMARARRS